MDFFERTVKAVVLYATATILLLIAAFIPRGKKK